MAACGGRDCPQVYQRKTCTVGACKPCAARIGQWSEWGSCSAKCGQGWGQKRRTRSVAGAKKGDKCPQGEEVVACWRPPCPVIDCTISSWSTWTTCSQPCSGGLQQRKRTIRRYPENNGRECPPSSRMVQKKNCNVDDCPYCDDIGQWSAWGSCSKTCGSGTQLRSRYVGKPRKSGAVCPKGKETKFCDAGPCTPINCKVSAWSKWSKTCSQPCGGGQVTRTRQILLKPQFGGSECPPINDHKACNAKPCTCKPVGAWTRWSECSADCPKKSGESRRSRLLPKKGCPKGLTASEVKTCTVNCPEDCILGAWSAWEKCSVTCGGKTSPGEQRRARTVERSASFGGKECTATYQLKQCVADDCPKPPQCDVGKWSSWAACSQPCGTGIKTRTRNIINTKFINVKSCNMKLVDTSACNKKKCKPPCKFSAWSEWQGCTKSCGKSFDTF